MRGDNMNLEDAKTVVKNIYKKYITAITDKQSQNKTAKGLLISTYTQAQNIWNQVPQTSSGAKGKVQAEAFFADIDEATSIKDLLLTILQKGWWGKNSGRLALLCVDLIVLECNLGKVPKNLYQNPAQPFADIDDLHFSKSDFYSTDTTGMQFRIAALSTSLKAFDDKTEYPLSNAQGEKQTICCNLKKNVSAAEQRYYTAHAKARSHR